MELDEAVKYVAGAYAVFVALLVAYVAILALRLDRMREELGELAGLAEARSSENPAGAEAGADQEPRGGAEGKVSLREPSSRQEVF